MAIIILLIALNMFLLSLVLLFQEIVLAQDAVSNISNVGTNDSSLGIDEDNKTNSGTKNKTLTIFIVVLVFVGVAAFGYHNYYGIASSNVAGLDGIDEIEMNELTFDGKNIEK